MKNSTDITTKTEYRQHRENQEFKKEIRKMQTAEITYEDSQNGTLHIGGLKIGELINNATMDDMGGSYFAHVETETEHGTIKIVWDTTEAWDNEEENTEEESTACDWEKFVVLDESREQIAQANG